MTGKIIAYSGTHGTGKSTAVYDRVSDLKRQYPNKLIGAHAENLVFCPYPINQDASEDSQLWIFTNHIQAELSLMTRYDVLVSDRCAVDSIAYTFVLGFNDLAARMMVLVQGHLNNYSEIVFMSAEDNPFFYDDGFRALDESFRKEVQEQIMWVYSQLGFVVVPDDNNRKLIVRS